MRKPKTVVLAAVALVSMTASCLFVAGVIFGAAAYRSGTSLCHECPIKWSKLPGEFRSTGADTLQHVPWVHTGVFMSLLYVAFIPLSCQRGRKIGAREVIAVCAILAVATPFATLGGLGSVFTLLNAFVWEGLTGEYFNEFWPVSEALFLLYLVAVASVLSTGVFRKWLPNSTQQLTRPGAGPAAELPGAA